MKPSPVASVSGADDQPIREFVGRAQETQIRLATPEVAIVSCIKTVHDGRSAAELATPLPSTGALTYVLTRVGGNWQIAVAQTWNVPGLVDTDLGGEFVDVSGRPLRQSR